ncbi:MAG TPA: ACP S-malonyltransferase [Ornithinibacter sp.]|uniref:ACP S-malonyltransferase n=1 Tax=Ornithinibacter sp. TaxID=2862748 RepID=UPI001B74B4AE|nr:ACP S-malonyltransferase [Ornithinibacter sp.]MBP6524651.1 ACP S-malonyltransferase [Dermatophilaceae bacterium]MBU9944187.1 ACP S-malonyltransferase [Dermatophilaceae bacterium]HNV40242.1 ACP S-malonyltransferase [Ornithinibacter sp.]HOB80514.1 ACP S-malonyltransferase [Ornithinibacter sp.]HOT56173.1 ACP S-malonyltransferase [Ornithinibacter sp.]
MIVIVCPGQGSQTPGFLSPWLELPGLRDQLSALSDAAQVDLVAHGTTSDEETIKDTAVAQPLLVGAGLLALRALGGGTTVTDAVPQSGAIAGHSVGEITAAAGAGVLSEKAAMEFVALRGRAMAQASAATPTGMSAVLGGDQGAVLATIGRHLLTPANVNGAGQVVAAGSLPALAELAADPPARARVIPLKVAGAFHTHYMEPAVAVLRAAAADHEVADPEVTLVSNRDGQVVTDGRTVLDRLVAQVSNPVRWDLCMERFTALGVTAIIELPPAGTLIGLAKRALKGVELLAVKTPDDLDAARTLIKEHSA